MNTSVLTRPERHARTTTCLSTHQLNTLSAYDSWAASYDTVRNVTRDLDLDVTARLLRGQRFLLTVEAGCGTGKNTPFFASISDYVLALDFSAKMLALARERAPGPQVQFEQADLLHRWPCADAVASLVSCNLVLEHIEHLAHIFNEAARVLVDRGTFFVSELHPFKQYLGGQARFINAQQIETRIEAHVHHLSDYLRAAKAANFALEHLQESWHADDTGAPPRLLSLRFRKKRTPE